MWKKGNGRSIEELPSSKAKLNDRLKIYIWNTTSEKCSVHQNLTYSRDSYHYDILITTKLGNYNKIISKLSKS